MIVYEPEIDLTALHQFTKSGLTFYVTIGELH